MASVHQGHECTVVILMQAGASVTQRNKNGDSAIRCHQTLTRSIARVNSRNLQCCSFLCFCGAASDAAARCRPAASAAAQLQKYKLAAQRLLFAWHKCCSCGAAGAAHLSLASSTCSGVSVVVPRLVYFVRQVLAACSALSCSQLALSQTDSNGASPLHVAAHCGNAAAITALLNCARECQMSHFLDAVEGNGKDRKSVV